MCGIVGLFVKNPALRPSLGRHIAAMLTEMTSRGPDSAGIAVYHRPAKPGWSKLTLFHDDPAYHWRGMAGQLADALNVETDVSVKAAHAVLTAETEEKPVRDWIAAHCEDVRVMGYGQLMEVYKEKGLPADVLARYGIAEMEGTHAIGHTRMATESIVTTEHSHPFTAAADMCLVHNGSLSNHNRLREWLRRRGMTFETDNDSEVAARYFAYRMGEGASLNEALEAGLKDLDGFYTFTMGTRDGFAVLRDAIACKPAVLAETDDWVAMGSEYRSLAHLPGVDKATIWEPKPAVVYTWSLQ
ncbi:MAG: glutamine amidotransferase family protein [Alphaproteobacteria bacterium]